MDLELLRILRCSKCLAALQLAGDVKRDRRGQVLDGVLNCLACERSYPIRDGIPRFVPQEGYVASFGRQWTRYRVEEAEEDRRTFGAKTGLELADLAGKWLLDAGCGSGRYSRVAAGAGAMVVGVDMSRAVDQAARLCHDLDHVHFIQADLLELPLADAWADAAFSIGVLHHASDPERAFLQVARTVKPGGLLAVWVYRRNTWLQEAINAWLRGLTTRMQARQLEQLAELAACLGAVPVVNRLLNKLVNFSNHPRWINRVCDTFDWYSPRYQFHHTESEVAGWFRQAGFNHLEPLPPEKTGRLYRWAYRRNLIVGSGLNFVGTKRPD